MTPATKHPRRAVFPAAAIAALLLAGCSSGNVGESWQCPLVDAGTCDSVAAADPAVPDMGRGRRDLLASGGWHRLHGGGPPFTLSDYRVFVTACLAAGPGPATETALGAFRRALEGTLASAGAQTRRLEPDALLSLAAELPQPLRHDRRRDGRA